MPEFLSTIFAKIKNIAQNGKIKEILAVRKPFGHYIGSFPGFFTCQGHFGIGNRFYSPSKLSSGSWPGCVPGTPQNMKTKNHMEAILKGKIFMSENIPRR